jgi:hypothetical protein
MPGKKLKRFLLRYNPPGLGFEFSENGEVELVHKDLPDRLTTAEEIFREVDRIIEEDDLLTPTKHRPALIQLVARLYQIEAQIPDEIETGKEKDSPTNAGAVFREGDSVVLAGLKGDLAMYNGEFGTVSKVRAAKETVTVTMTGTGAEVKVKTTENNVYAVARAPLLVGTPVLIRGLRNHTELNGCLGRVVECYEESHRFEVRATESGQLFRVKAENIVSILNSQGYGSSDSAASLERVPGGGEDLADVYEAGSSVELQGLKTATVYNGQQAEVLSVDRVRSRYEIRLGDGSVKTIRAENVRLISRPSKSSPRTRRKEGGSKAADRGK